MTAWELADLVSDDELLAHADDPDCVWEIERRLSAVSGEPNEQCPDCGAFIPAVSGEPNE